MTDSAATVAAPASFTSSQLGSFVIGARVDVPDQRLGDVAIVSTTGLPETRYAGIAAHAYCTPLGNLDSSKRELASSYLSRIKVLSAATLVPVLETGLTGSAAYVAELRARISADP